MEKWKDVVGYEGIYQVSLQGRVKSINHKNHRGNMIYGRMLKLKRESNGYLRVNLVKDGRSKQHSVHRLVAKAFIPNPQNLETVNHKDEDKTNNAVSNLEWLSIGDNIRYGTGIKRSLQNRDFKKMGEKVSLTKKLRGQTRPIIQYDLNMNELARYDSIQDAARANKIDNTGISIALHHRYGCKTYKGCIWKFAGAL